MVGSGQLDEAGAGDPLGDVAAFLDAHVEVGAAVDDERRDADRRQQRADVDQRVHLHERLDGAGAGGGAAALAPPARHRLVGGRAHELHVGLEAPVALQILDVGGARLARRRPGVVVVGVEPLRVGAVEDQRARPLGIGRGEEDRHRRALGVAEQHGAAAVDRVHDRAHVVHARLEVGHAGRPVGEAGAALVEADQAGDRAEPFEEVRVARLLPVLLEVGDEAGDEHEVDRPVAGHLVGDVEVAAARVADRRANRRPGRALGAHPRRAGPGPGPGGGCAARAAGAPARGRCRAPRRAPCARSGTHAARRPAGRSGRARASAGRADARETGAPRRAARAPAPARDGGRAPGRRRRDPRAPRDGAPPAGRSRAPRTPRTASSASGSPRQSASASRRQADRSSGSSRSRACATSDSNRARSTSPAETCSR